MAYTQQQLREILAQHPGAEAVCPHTGRVWYASQRVNGHYVPGVQVRAMYADNPHEAPGAQHCDDAIPAWQLGVPHIRV